MIYALFVVLYAATFIPAWYLLLKLVALAGSKKSLSFHFWAYFLLYQAVIVLPYAYLLIAGRDTLGSIVNSVLIGLIAVSCALSIIRFFLSDYVNRILWYVYGHVYDGLLHFYPYQHLQEIVAAEVGPKKTEKILDLGAGSGNQTMLLYKNAGSIDAVDSSVSMLARLKKKIQKRNIRNVTVIESDLMDFVRTCPDDSYDKVVMVNVLYTVSDRKELLRQLMRLTKKNGKIIVTNSDKGGSSAMIREHIANKGLLTLLRPSLVAVFVIDSLISEMAKTGQYSFIKQETLEKEVKTAGGLFRYITRCYGGPVDGVNILFSITHN